MGMYDNLKINTKKLPLSVKEKMMIGEYHDWQTKDFECILSTAEITEDNKLKFFYFKYTWDENIKSGLTEITGKMGGLITTNEHWEYLKYDGYINFYSSINNIWYEFNAEFENGILKKIKRVK